MLNIYARATRYMQQGSLNPGEETTTHLSPPPDKYPSAKKKGHPSHFPTFLVM